MTKFKLSDLTTYQKTNMNFWLKEFFSNKEEHLAYIALNFSGHLNDYENKYNKLIEKHKEKSLIENTTKHLKAIEKLNNCVIGFAVRHKNHYVK